MYRITPKNAGKYNNVSTGPRYCLTKKSAKELVNTFLESECEVEVKKFTRIHTDIFCWANCWLR